MAEEKKYIAVDLGAESGRVMLGLVSADRFVLEEIHRFSNGPLQENSTLRWNFNKLLSEIQLEMLSLVSLPWMNISGPLSAVFRQRMELFRSKTDSQS